MGVSKVLLLAGVGIVSAGVGVAIPLVMSSSTKVADAAVVSDEGAEAEAHAPAKTAEKSDGHGKADSHAKPSPKKDDGHGKGDAKGKEGAQGKDGGHGDKAGVSAPTGPQFVPFGRIVVNLNEPALTKYLSLDITLLADGKDDSVVRSAVEERLPILRTWLTSHLADKTMEDVRGKAGVNRLRREIQDQFNALLFEDGRERVRDVLFEEFHVE